MVFEKKKIIIHLEILFMNLKKYVSGGGGPTCLAKILCAVYYQRKPLREIFVLLKLIFV